MKEACRLVILIGLLAATSGRLNAELVFQFDRFRDAMVVSTDTIQVTGGWSVLAMYSHPGENLGAPMKRFDLLFLSYPEGWTNMEVCHRNGCEVLLLVDGRRRSLGRGAFDGSVGSGYVSENFTVEVGPEAMAMLSKAESVEVSIGLSEFRLTPKALRALSEMYAARTPAGQSAAKKLHSERRKAIDALENALTKESVERVLGPADSTATFAVKSGEREVWVYRALDIAVEFVDGDVMEISQIADSRFSSTSP